MIVIDERKKTIRHKGKIVYYKQIILETNYRYESGNYILTIRSVNDGIQQFFFNTLLELQVIGDENGK